MGQLIAAASPLLLVLYLMLGRKWGSSRAGPVGWVLAIVFSTLFFGGGLQLIVVALGKSVLLALFVLYIIWMALLFYHVVNEAGAIAIIGSELPRLARDRATQALLLAWVFGSFLQGASGFGVPAAVIAPLLVGLGFAPTTGVVVALVGHGWAVTFGSLGSSFSALMAATGLSADALAADSAQLLFLCCFLCGVICLWATNRWLALRQQLPRLLLWTVVMGGVQWWLAVAGFWNLAAFGGGLAGLVVAMIDLRLGMLDFGRKTAVVDTKLDLRRLLNAFFPYILLIIVILLGQFPLADPLSVLTLNINFPEVTTSNGWRIAAGPGRSLNVLGHAGALLLYTSLLTFFYFRQQVRAQPYRWSTIQRKTINGSKKTTISVLTLLAMAVTMEHAGMTNLLAEMISANTGAAFPLLSPFIGALGSFMTGSNTNSNVVFASLQQQTAVALGVSVPLVLAAQTAGGAIGSFFAPAKVVVGCSTVEGTDDARVLRAITGYGLLIVGIIGVLTWILA